MVIHKVVIVFIPVPHFSVVVPLAGSVCMSLIILLGSNCIVFCFCINVWHILCESTFAQTLGKWLLY